MALKNTTVLLTIHQPSSEIFFLLDIVVFMKAGRIFYQGPVGEVSNYFNRLGYSCPLNYNPCDYVMSLCQSESEVELEKKNLFIATPIVVTSTEKRAGSIDSDSANVQGNEIITNNSGYCKQLYWLIGREYRNLTRNYGGMLARFGMTIFLSVLFGLIFLDAGKKSNANETDFTTHFGALTMVTMSTMISCAQPAMLEFPFERPMFLREYVTGTCK